MSKLSSRRQFLTYGGLGMAAAVIDPATALAAGDAPADGVGVTPELALQLLVSGNQRWVTGKVTHPRQSIRCRRQLREDQHPFATVLSCIDSRVPPELVFDCGLGDLAVARTGAQVLDHGIVLGSVEFAADRLATPLIFVMGHQRCGAVKSAIDLIKSGGAAPGHIQPIVDALRPAYAAVRDQPGDMLENMVQAQTRLTVDALQNDPLIRGLIERGRVQVNGGYYSLDTGKVSVIA